MKKLLFSALSVVLILTLVFAVIPFAIEKTMPQYKDSIGNNSDDLKIQGLYLLEESAKREDNVIIYGSSELRTDYISTHPANFFENKKAGFQVNLVGRGSCQGIIHAMSIAASGESLKNSPVVLITSPQSYVKDGITPDMFFANFSKQQFITIVYDNTLPNDIKQRFAKRVCQMLDRYDEQFGKLQGYDDIRILANAVADDGFLAGGVKTLTAPYYLFSRYMSENKDMIDSAKLIRSALETQEKNEEIDYAAEEKKAIEVAKKETTNNDFGMRDSDYKKNVGNKLSRFENRDKNLSYTESIEYDDLRLLLDICEHKGIEPLFVSVPLHGSWSDYTGFTKDRRQEYYTKVKSVVSEYDAQFLDLSGYEYDEYFLCDTMHLGWKGWLKVNEEIDRFYKEFNQ